MKTIILKGHKVIEGHAEGEALVTKEPISFMGSIDPKTGIVIERGHDIEGQCLKGKILVFPTTKGSTGGSYILYEVVKNGVGPLGIINTEAESVVVIGAIISDLPMIDKIDIKKIKTGDYVVIDGDNGIIKVRKKEEKLG